MTENLCVAVSVSLFLGISAQVRYQKRCHEQEEQRHADADRHSAFALNFQHELRPKSESRQES